MTDLNIEGIANHNNNYNEEPVYHCTRCLSLAIMESEGTMYCDKCGNTDIQQANIFDWENLYKGKYGDKYLNT